jgi:transposase-like protein
MNGADTAICDISSRMKWSATVRAKYVRGEVHTNNIESFWSLLKRGVIGTYHHVSKKYLPLYLAEFQFRFNNRNNDDIFGEAVRGC